MDNRRRKLCLPKQYLKHLVVLPVAVFVVALNATILIGFVREEPFFIALATSGSSILIGILEAVLIALAISFLVLTTHHIAGPMYALERAIKALGHGDLDARVTFRKHDLSHNLAEAFSEAAGELRSRILHLQRLAAELERSAANNPKLHEGIAHLHRELMVFKATPVVKPEEPQQAAGDRPSGKEGGFTLVELMIVVAIVSILLVIAMPMYSDYTIRTRVTEGVKMMGPVKQAIAEYYFTNAEMPEDNRAAGMSDAIDYHTREVQKLEVEDGIATITFSISSLGSDNTLVYSPVPISGGMDWDCNRGSLEPKYRPPICRQH